VIQIRSIRAAIAVLAAAAVSIVAAPRAGVANPPGISVADFRGGDAVLVQAPGIRITEADLFLYSVVTRLLDPQIATRWKDLTEQEKNRVREVLDLQAQFLMSSREAPDSTTASDIEFASRAARIYASPAARILWADKVVRRTVRVFPEDLLYHFAQSPEKFTEETIAVVRRLRVPVPPESTREQREAALVRAQELRVRAATGGGLEPLLAEAPELLVDPPGRLLEVKRNARDIDPQIVTEAFRLGRTQISAPILTPGGYVLVEVVEREEKEPEPLSAVLPRIEADLRANFLPQQFEYLLAEKATDSFGINRARLFQFMPDDADIIRVREFNLTLGEFKAMYPELIGDPDKPNKLAVGALAHDILVGEVVTQEIEKAGLASDPFYLGALEMGAANHRSATYVRAKRAEIDPLPEEVDAYLAENREKIAPSSARIVWAFSIGVRDVGALSRAELDAMRILMSGYMADMIEDAAGQLRDRQSIASDRGFLDPDKVVTNLSQPSDKRVRTRFEKRGPYTFQNAPLELGVEWDELQVGGFTRPQMLRSGDVVSYYVSEEVPAPNMEEEELLAIARTKLIEERSLATFVGELKRMKEAGEFIVAPELRAANAAGVAMSK